MNKINIEVKKIETLYSTLFGTASVIFILTFVVYHNFAGLVPSENLNIWMGLNIVVYLLRVTSFFFHKKSGITPCNVSKYYKIFFLLSFLSAIVWGLGAFFILPDGIEYTILLLLFISGMVSSAAVSLASKIEIFFIYVCVLLLPFIYIFFVQDLSFSTSYTFAIFIFILVSISIAFKVSKTMNDNILLVFQQEDLVHQLEEKIEETTKANRAKSDFLSVMSHEIRTPLNAIIGFVDILRKDEKDEKKSHYLHTIAKSSNVLTNVINDILDISKIESGKFTLEMTEFHPEDELSTLLQLFEQNALEKGVLMHKHLETLPQTLKGDVLRVKQILSNLLSNAIKFTPAKKKIDVHIKYNTENSLLYVCVQDEGIGISKKNIDLVTQAFTQADDSTAREYGGTGLGLSIVTKLLQLLDSELKIESELGKGSSFSFYIEMEEVEQERDMLEESQRVFYPTKKILVAEDNITNQMLISLLLEDLEIEVKMANDGAIAEELFQAEEFDMVFMDINMPKKNGIEAMQAIKAYEQQEKKSPTPIVALTANSVSGDRKKYMDEGFDGYIAKPIDIQELEKVLQYFFKV